jgi:hypothetical protein
MKIYGTEFSKGEFLCLLILAIAVWFVLNVFYLWLWDIIAIKIFALPALSFWQMIGLRLLVRSFFGGMELNDIVGCDN